ncbi:MAG: serine/threonine protein kinase [Planctomycetes bacterium]|nr:serine/threonine protein kinase [Planctomycetota bacterium]
MGVDEPTPDARERLREIVAACLEQVERDGPSAIDDACARHPELADAIRRRIERLRELGLFGAPAPLAIPRRLGDFDLGAVIGEGGMGVVYEARQRSLGRDVALKVIRSDLQPTANSRARFQREIEAVSRLSHPSIVPIYAVGEEQGIPYFAMERIDGATVAEVLARLRGRPADERRGDDFWAAARAAPADRRDGGRQRSGDSTVDGRLRGRSWSDTCLFVVQQAALALDHAHRRGVLHRDMKPHNVMVTPEGRVVVMDFGLAAAEGSAELTRSGAELGSLRFMAPEQLRGQRDAVHETTDVYGLGVTLYELLTLAPAFDAPDDEAIRRAIAAGDFPPPRARVPSLPRDVETACLVAMERDPRRRYASAAAFAEDLERLQQRQPIAARRMGPALRARRWCERHPALATALLLMTVLTAASTWFAFEQSAANTATNAALGVANAQTEHARRQSDRAERNVERAQRAIELMLTRFADQHLRRLPQVEQIRTALLADAVALQEAVLAEESDDPAVRRATASAWDRLGRIQQELGRAEEASRSLEKALALREEFIADRPDDLLANDEVALGWHDLGNMARALGRFDASERHFRHAIALTEASLARHPDKERGFGLTLGRSLNDLSITLDEQGRHAEALASCGRALELLAPLVEANPGHRNLMDQLGMALQRHAAPLLALERPEEAAARLEEALPWRRKVVALDPADRDARQQLGLLLFGLAHARRIGGDAESAGEPLEEALTVQRALLAEEPTSAWMRWDVAQSLHEQGLIADDRAELEAAVEAFRASIALYEPLIAEDPKQPGYAHEGAACLADLARRLVHTGDATGAVAAALRALELDLATLERVPDHARYRQQWRDDLALARLALELAGKNEFDLKPLLARIRDDPRLADLLAEE